eukprot:CAMPEP_0204832582 /NCGR_PEP_ID=MMETSP1346-20131115/14211_1 /ASSEMBLY_ACC=CAM_ASM_000771 /TAXON_ID=215587 /ORGANISM="Aplanochytrium stocchinoi, Strain GSBS06" /LENGTH=475 /DNA_ID=CAMNT_0051964499 /DNA_START=84 /DNA_END=1508 /DNA_ORIENTATION=-
MSSQEFKLISPDDPLWDPCLKTLSASRELNKCHMVYSAMLRVRGTKAKTYIATHAETQLGQIQAMSISVVLLLKTDEQMAVISTLHDIDDVLQNDNLLKEIAETLHREMNSVKSIRVMGELQLVKAINEKLSIGFKPSWSVCESVIKHSHELPLTWKPATKDAVRSQEEEGLSYFVLRDESEKQDSDSSDDEEIEFFHSESESLVSLFWPNNEDMQAVATICKEFYACYINNLPGYKNRTEPTDFRKYAVKMIEEQRILLCRHIDGSIIGSAGIDVLIGGVARLSHIFVRRAFRGRRLGARMITALCSSIREKDLNCRIFLFVDDSNIALQRSIHRVGFRPSPATVSFIVQHYANENNYRYYNSAMTTSAPTPAPVPSFPNYSTQYSYAFTDGNKYCPREIDILEATPHITLGFQSQASIPGGNLKKDDSQSLNNNKSKINVNQENNCGGVSEASFSDPEPEAEDVYEDDEIQKW